MSKKYQIVIITPRLGTFYSQPDEMDESKHQNVLKMIQNLIKYCDNDKGYYTMYVNDGIVTFPMAVIRKSVVKLMQWPRNDVLGVDDSHDG